MPCIVPFICMKKTLLLLTILYSSFTTLISGAASLAFSSAIFFNAGSGISTLSDMIMLYRSFPFKVSSYSATSSTPAFLKLHFWGLIQTPMFILVLFNRKVELLLFLKILGLVLISVSFFRESLVYFQVPSSYNITSSPVSVIAFFAQMMKWQWKKPKTEGATFSCIKRLKVHQQKLTCRLKIKPFHLI